MLNNLTSKLSNIAKTVSGNARLTTSNIEEALREVRIALFEADVAIEVVKWFIDEVKQEAIGQKVLGSLRPGEALIGVVHDKLVSLMGAYNETINLNATPPVIMLLAGLQGAGKTTTAAKLAKRLKEQENKKVLLVSVDVYRKAAMEQLATLANNIGVEVFPTENTQNPLTIARMAHDFAQRNYFDVLIVDSAGRLAIDEQMMEEIKGLHETLKPTETLFVADAMLGQEASNIAKAFNDSVPLTGIILTKMDGDARGGAALSVRHVTGKPIKFIGVSEKMQGLEPFYPERIASRILGMGDVLSLIEEVKSTIEEKKGKEMLEKVRKGKKFDFNDLKLQFEQMHKMGGLDSVMEKLPAGLANQLPTQLLGTGMVKQSIAIINSMTHKERRTPDILKASRKRRIALGSGTSVQEVNQLIKRFEQINTMMKQFSGGNMLKMMNKFKHLMPK